MINSNELRIGNWVYIGELIGQCNADSFKDTSIFNPIPLTPEILEKAGFERMPLASYKRWVKYHPTFYLQLSKGYYYIISYKYYPNGINSVHQLQNLYFALTGEELNIQL